MSHALHYLCCVPKADVISPSTVPRMTPILRNRHEKVQEATINLIGRIGMYFALAVWVARR